MLVRRGDESLPSLGFKSVDDQVGHKGVQFIEAVERKNCDLHLLLRENCDVIYSIQPGFGGFGFILADWPDVGKVPAPLAGRHTRPEVAEPAARLSRRTQPVNYPLRELRCESRAATEKSPCVRSNLAGICRRMAKPRPMGCWLPRGRDSPHCVPWWGTRGLLNFSGKFHTLSGAHIRPRPLQQPFPKFYLGGGSRQAWEMSAKHSDVHLFWGDLPERIADNIAEIREMAKAHGRDNDIGFGMRLQVICREDEKDAWEAADALVRNATERQNQQMKARFNNPVTIQRVQQLARAHGDLLLPHLWTGITR